MTLSGALQEPIALRRWGPGQGLTNLAEGWRLEVLALEQLQGPRPHPLGVGGPHAPLGGGDGQHLRERRDRRRVLGVLLGKSEQPVGVIFRLGQVGAGALAAATVGALAISCCT